MGRGKHLTGKLEGEREILTQSRMPTTKGGVIKFPSDPAQWPASMWDDAGEGWIRLRRRDWWQSP